MTTFSESMRDLVAFKDKPATPLIGEAEIRRGWEYRGKVLELPTVTKNYLEVCKRALMYKDTRRQAHLCFGKANRVFLLYKLLPGKVPRSRITGVIYPLSRFLKCK